MPPTPPTPKNLYDPLSRRPASARTLLQAISAATATAVALFLLTTALPGCKGTGAQGGLFPPAAPGNDPIVVNAERTVELAFTSVDAFLQAEKTAQPLTTQSLPEVHAVAERLRQDAPATFQSATAAIKAYKAARSPAASSTMEDRIAEVETLARLAREAMAKLPH